MQVSFHLHKRRKGKSNLEMRITNWNTYLQILLCDLFSFVLSNLCILGLELPNRNAEKKDLVSFRLITA